MTSGSYSLPVDFKLELVIVPVADVDRAKALHPARADYGSFFSFSDPDGNGWLVQEVRSRA